MQFSIHMMPGFTLFCRLLVILVSFLPLAAQKHITILPIGTSITFGIGSSEGNGYRKMLFEKLLDHGLHANFLGTQQNGPFSLCEGYPGKIISFFQDSIVPRAMKLGQPDFVLLEAGANDMSYPIDPDHAVFRLSNLIDKLVTAFPNANILVTSVTPIWTNRVIAFNKDLPGLIQIKQAQGLKVALCDMYNAGIGINDVPDAIHPNDAGYAKMAQVWHDAIVQIHKNLQTPGQPNNVSVQAGPLQCIIRWTAAFRASGYKIYKSLSANGPFKEAGTIADHFWFADTAVKHNVTYHYKVAATNNEGEGEQSKAYAATPFETLPIAVNCGGPKTAGFEEDFGYDDGRPSNWFWDKINLKSVTNQNAVFVYKTGRTGNFTYTFDRLSPAKYYHLKLHFVEGEYTQPGKRIFHVEINGIKKLFNYDIFEKTNARNMAHSEVFHIKPDAKGTMLIRFISVVGDAHVSGIEIGN